MMISLTTLLVSVLLPVAMFGVTYLALRWLDKRALRRESQAMTKFYAERTQRHIDATDNDGAAP